MNKACSQSRPSAPPIAKEDHGADLGMSPNDTIFVDEYVRRCRELETLVYDKDRATGSQPDREPRTELRVRGCRP